MFCCDMGNYFIFQCFIISQCYVRGDVDVVFMCLVDDFMVLQIW